MLWHEDGETLQVNMVKNTDKMLQKNSIYDKPVNRFYFVIF